MSMKDEEFNGCPAEQVQSQFFLTALPFNENGRYLFCKSGLNAEPGTVVLFQYDGKIIASAILDRQERFDEPEQGCYHGALFFNIASIRVFDPVRAWVLRQVWPTEFKRFGNVKTQLDPTRLDAFERHLTNIRTPAPRVQTDSSAETNPAPCANP
jgi:hypothetical protein